MLDQQSRWLSYHVLVVSADTGILWNGACILLIGAHRDTNILLIIFILFVKMISYLKNLYAFESWYNQTTLLCVFVYKSSDKIHIFFVFADI